MVLQPNFEKIKIVVVETAKKDVEFTFKPLYQTILSQKKDKTYHEKYKDNINELYSLLDTIGIQQVGIMIEYAKGKLPKWIVDKQFVIDYNNNEMLDLIKI